MKKSTIMITILTLVAITTMGTTVFATKSNKTDAVSSATIKKEGTTTPTAEQQVQIDKLVKELSDLSIKENNLDIEEDQLELSYHKGEITYATYKEKDAAIEKQDRALDLRENEVERELKALGYQRMMDRDNDCDCDNDNDYDDDNDNDWDD